MLRQLLPPEAQVLLLAAGTSETDESLRDVASRDLDWARLSQLADREYAAPVLWRRLHSLGPDVLPQAAAAALRQLATVVHFRMAYLEQRLRDSVSALEKAQIECVLLKGTALATTVYPAFAERPMLDIDLLVPADRAEDAAEVLLSSGWAAYGGEQPAGHNGQPHHHLLPLLDARGMSIVLEVHRSLLPTGHPFAFSTDAVWSDSRLGARGMSWARVPSPHHLLLHTCIHLAWSHLFRKGAWRAFRDVRALISTGVIDWKQFVELAHAAKADSCCYWTFRLARELMGVEIPTRAVSALRPPLADVALRLLERHFAMILFPTRVDCPSVTLRRVLWSAAMLPRWSGHGRSRRWGIPSATPEPPRDAMRPNPARGQADGAQASLASWACYGRTLLFGGHRLRTGRARR